MDGSNHVDSLEDPTSDGLSIIPIDKGGVAICKICAYIGLTKHFYTKEFCCRRCSRVYQAKIKRTPNATLTHEFQFDSGTDHLVGMIPMEPIPQLETRWPVILDDLMQPSTPKISQITNTYEWNHELFGCDFLAAPVKLFKHAPLNEMWDNTFEGMKVEVRNNDCDTIDYKISDFFWVATVIKVKGYMGQMRYEGFGSDCSKDFWVNLCCSEVHPVGWCATRGKPLIPPKTIEGKYNDWKKFLVKQLTGARTLPANFYNKFRDSLISRFCVGTVLEVVDKNRISQVKVASVREIIGKRLHIKYYNSGPDDNGFWCHEDSPLIHPVGWAFSVGHTLDAPDNYLERIATGILNKNDSTPDMFSVPPLAHLEDPGFVEGMKLEAVDPLNLSSVCAATVMRVLNNGYMMIRIDVYPADALGGDWFCYHQRSPCIFPVGFCAANKIPLVPPIGYSKESFDWATYLSQTNTMAAGPELFAARSSAEHGFVSGMRLECADLMDPRLVCVATVARVVGNMLKVHFDGWGEEYDQWLWGSSTDMYPVGWCKAVGHRLEGPLQPAPPLRPPPKKPTRQSRSRKRKTRINVPEKDNSQTSRESSQSLASHNVTETSPSPTTIEDSSKSQTSMSPSPNEDSCNKSMSIEDNNTRDKLDETNFDEAMEDDIIQLPQVNGGEKEKIIPRIDSITPINSEIYTSVDPESWTCQDVSRFLTVNDCSTYCVNFSQITGPALLQLTKDEIIELLEMKVGPSLKIYDLIQQLKLKIRPRMSIFKKMI